MRLRVLESGLFLTDCRTRLPFRFGISTLTVAPLCTARILVETDDGTRGEGYSSDLLVPKWFEKDPQKSSEDDVRALIASAQDAGDRLTSTDRGAATVFDHWLDLDTELVASRDPNAQDRLVRGFGIALLERAMIDAVCRIVSQSFFETVRGGYLGFEPGRADPDLLAWNPAQSLPARPAESVAVRHTVGLLDALREEEIDAADRRNDGFPESLEADVARYGLTHFKIKLCGRREEDLERLRRISALLASASFERAQITIDGNEQFETLADLADLLDALARDDAGRRLLAGLLLVEQPLARSRTFDAPPNAAIDRVARHAPVIIDEADASLDAFPCAVGLGYRGVSVKNCKGVFRALINRGRCDLSSGRLFQSAEDLTNLPAIALQQDLATVGLLGLTHVERNGHHFFRGLDHLPDEEARAALAAHPDLYVEDERGISLRIESGRLSLTSIATTGFGGSVSPSLDARTPASEWRWPSDA